MAQFEENRRRTSKTKQVKKILRVDLTPMVDLGFLLITFFILTTALSQPTVAKLIMPKDSPVHTTIKENATLTLMLTRNDSITYYEGAAIQKNMVYHCSLANLRTVIQQKQLRVAGVLGNKEETVIIISPGKQSSYKNFVNVLDEIQINDIKHYFVVDEESDSSRL